MENSLQPRVFCKTTIIRQKEVGIYIKASMNK